MNLKERMLHDFALATLEILEYDQEWSCDTLDNIGAAAYDHNLAYTDIDNDSLFKRTDMGTKS